MIDQSLMQPLKDRKFRFACHRNISCFTKCCTNLNLVLTPYDVLRLKNRLSLSSDEFLRRYTTCYVDEKSGVPLVKLNMINDEKHRCPFVSLDGCAVYEDRPGACRLYPLGRAASKMVERQQAGEYYFLIRESHCLGFAENHEWQVEEWLEDQGMKTYNFMNDLFMDITAGRQKKTMKKLSHQQLQMYYMASYSLDDFRRFVFESSFLDRFSVESELIHRIKTDETELMAFANQWLKFSLFGQNTFQLAVTQ